MRKWIKRILAALGILFLAFFLAIYFGGRWAAGHYLARELAVGQGKLRLVAPEFRWSLDLDADSLLYDSPTLKASVGRTRVSADLFKSLLRFSPSVTLDVDTVSLRIFPGPDTVKPRPDSLPFPAFRIPATVRVRAGRILVADTAGPLVRCDGLLVETHGAQGAGLSIRELQARPLGTLTQSLTADASWEAADRVSGRIVWRRGGDSIAVAADAPKANLLRAGAALRAHLASSEPYAKALKLAPRPRADAFDASFRASLDGPPGMEGDLKARVSGLPDSLPIKLGPQNLAIRIAFKEGAGTWSVTSRGQGSENVALAGTLFATARDSLSNPAWLARHLGATAKGHLRGFQVTAGGKQGVADLEVRDLRASADAIRAQIVTGDGSRILADLGRAPGQSNNQATPPALPPWNGTFSAQIAPGERWLVAFTDTNVAFRKFAVDGRIAGGEASAVVQAFGLKAYGVAADSLRLDNRYGRAGYVLAPSHLYRRGLDWELSGKVGLSQRDRPMAFRVANAKYGSVEAAMPRPDLMEAHVRNLALEQLPYQKLDTLKANQPRVSADFRWDKRARSGTADVTVDGKYKGETLQAHAHADWDPQTLTVKDTRASLSGNGLTASAAIRLHGRQFYELGKLDKADVQEVSLGADRFDLAKALKVAMPEPPIKSGLAMGRIGYNAASGFSGTYRLQDIHLNSEQERFSIKELVLSGRGDTVVLRAVTVSDQEELFRDSVTVAVTGVLARVQTFAVTARAGQGIFADFRGTVTGFKEMQGRLGVHGNVALPQGSGELRNLQVRAGIELPFQGGLKGLRVQADTLGGEYAVAGVDTQTFSAPVSMRGGRIEIPDLTMKGRNGSQLHGRIEFDPASQRLLADISGASLAAQLGAGDKVRLQELRVQAQMDSTLMTAQVAVGSGSIEHIKSPMRATADFSRLAVFYRAPLGKPKTASGAQIPFLRVSAVLDSSLLRYRMRSLESITGIFKKQGNQRRSAVRRAKPMQVQINVETAGGGNAIETDVLRLSYVGNVSMNGTYPYALMQGRVSAHDGSLGLKKQAYNITQMEVKWLNAPMEEGELELNAEKKLARTCELDVTDSCSIKMQLTGQLNDIKFAYDSDCRGGYGSGSADVAALIYSVRRGCYSPQASTGVAGLSYQEQALGLLEPLASNYLSQAAEKLSGKWIASAQVTGLGALAQDKKAPVEGDTAAATRDAIGLEILSKEFWRLRLRARSAYNLANADNPTPWTYRVGVEWQPPLFRMVDDPVWRNRIKNKITVDASVFTDPSRTPDGGSQDQLLRRLGLNYNYDWWGYWWTKAASPPPAKQAAPAAEAAPAAPGGRKADAGDAAP